MDPHLYHDSGKTCHGGGMHCPNTSSCYYYYPTNIVTDIRPGYWHGKAGMKGVCHAFSWEAVVGSRKDDASELLLRAVNCGRFCFWRRQSAVCLFVCEISRKLLNGFARNSHGRRVAPLSGRV